MKVIIMAAGRATRMLPLTKNMPKCLLKLNKKTILQHQIDILKKCGIKNIVIITGHHAEKIEKLYGKKNGKLETSNRYGCTAFLAEHRMIFPDMPASITSPRGRTTPTRSGSR